MKSIPRPENSSRIVGMIALSVILAAGWGCSRKEEPKKDAAAAVAGIETSLHPNAVLREAAPPKNQEYKSISAREAISFALQHLAAKGAEHVAVCETQ